MSCPKNIEAARQSNGGWSIIDEPDAESLIKASHGITPMPGMIGVLGEARTTLASILQKQSETVTFGERTVDAASLRGLGDTATPKQIVSTPGL